MQLVNRFNFYTILRQSFGNLSQEQVDNINFLLDCLEKDDLLVNFNHAAYVLATVKHETADTYAPIAEYGKGKGRVYGNPDAETGQTYYGRGYVQLTWKDNYRTFGNLLGIDLLNSPDLAMVPADAYKIMSIGMVKGLFTGKKLSDFDSLDQFDFLHARKIINGMDRAVTIAKYARVFKEALGND